MSKKTFNLITGIVGALQTAGVAIVTYTSPEYATAINSAIVIAGTAIIEICNLFTTEAKNEAV
jgi:ethanolamine utilization microcompartment shell protein EutL